MNKPNMTSAVIAIGVWILVLQNAGIIPPITTAQAQERVLDVNIVGASETLDVRVEGGGTLDVNLASVASYPLTTSQNGMSLGVASKDNKLIPIHWGEVTVAQ